MKKYLFLILLMSMVFCDDVKAYVYDHSVSIASFEPDNNIEIENGVVITSTDVSGITTDRTVHLYNGGYIDGSINPQGNNLFVYNSGIINGAINANGSNVVQVIRSDAENHTIDVVGGNMFVMVVCC